MSEWRVFISHKKEDEGLAKQVAQALHDRGFGCYLDAVDTHINMSGDDLASYIRSKLDGCDALIAVVSENTKRSQWVPWEIGVATEKDYPLATFLSGSGQVPEFLEKWPVMRTLSQIPKYVAQAEATQVKFGVIEKGMFRGASASSMAQDRRVAVAEFHKGLKAALKP